MTSGKSKNTNKHNLLISRMMTVKGNDGNTIWEHCLKVKNILLEVLQNLKSIHNLKSKYPVPTWLEEHWYLFHDMKRNWKAIRTGVKFHDCGKPFCITESGGVKHFPEHWKLSAEKFKEYAGEELNFDEFQKLCEREPNFDMSSIYERWERYKCKLSVQKQAESYIRRDLEAHIVKLDDESIKNFLSEDGKYPDHYEVWKTSLELILICYCAILSNCRNDSKKSDKAFLRIETLGTRAIELMNERFPNRFDSLKVSLENS
ncbi:hypothetical protein [Leptospira sp. 'Mane']|uniref:hypothetical protein n=1 Tax=Leptospira sp. 'Mane' TaxID=3387407 RepID=UPI00398AA661